MAEFRCVVMVSLVREDTFITDCKGYRAYRADPRTSQHSNWIGAFDIDEYMVPMGDYTSMKMSSLMQRSAASKSDHQ